MDAYVYILKSIEYGCYYIGFSTNLDHRLKQHNSGKVTSTKCNKPWKIVFSQKYNSIPEARRIEAKLKSWKRKDYLERIIKDKIIKVQ